MVNPDHKTPWNRGSSGAAANQFTLIELLVSMTVLVILMMMLMMFMISMQKTWVLSDSTSRIYHNSRVVFDILEADLKTMVASSSADAEIGFYLGDPGGADDLYLTLVSATQSYDSNATCRMIEISYRFSDTGNDAFILRRQEVCNTHEQNWNFYNRPANWYRNDVIDSGDPREPPEFEAVIGGIKSFNVQFYDSSDNRIPDGTDSTVMPSRVVVNLELFNEALTDAPEAVRFQTQRAFSKIFSMGRIQN